MDQITYVMSLENDLEKEIRVACKKSKRYIGNRVNKVLSMLDQLGAKKTVETLVMRNSIPDFFVNLFLCGKLNLTIEHIICRKAKYKALFSDELLTHALKKIV